MSGSGSREGSGSPPWDPAEPVPEPEDTQSLPGLGVSGARRPTGTGRPTGARRPTGTSLGNGVGPEPGGPAPGITDAPEPEPAPDAGTGAAGPDGEGNHNQDGEPRKPPGHRRPRRRSLVRELPVLIVVALVLALVIKTYAIQAFFIPSSSMENTLDVGDRVLINKFVYDFRGIHRGDIVVFDGNGSWDFNQPTGNSNIFSRFFSDVEGIVGISHDSDIYIKRVIGLPGDRVACCDSQGRVTVNSVPLSEQSYVFPGEVPSAQRFNITVPQGRLWVMGDHRQVSFDSRGHMGSPGGGTIPESAVLGRAFVIIWPPSRWGFLNIPVTFEQPRLDAAAVGERDSNAALAKAMDSGTPLKQSPSALPIALGFAGAIPLTWLQALARRKLWSRKPWRKIRRRNARPHRP